ncbi:hypothetical protein K9M79_02855 [Candidatus Woesearchaeota archaeon]|nr:hypothetical protein [Candidatus Woesearchaeota archaeon]
MSKYIDENEFRDFKQNFHALIKTFNHEIGDLKKSSRQTVSALNNIEKLVAGMGGKLGVLSKLVWWILGIISVIVGAACLASIG